MLFENQHFLITCWLYSHVIIVGVLIGNFEYRLVQLYFFLANTYGHLRLAWYNSAFNTFESPK